MVSVSAFSIEGQRASKMNQSRRFLIFLLALPAALTVGMMIFAAWRHGGMMWSSGTLLYGRWLSLVGGFHVSDSPIHR